MHAVRAGVLGLPAASGRWQKARIAALRRVATSAAMYGTARPLARPALTVRRPRSVPESARCAPPGQRRAGAPLTMRQHQPHGGYEPAHTTPGTFRG